METYYGNEINLSGLYSDKPVECKVTESGIAWDSEGWFSIDPKNLGVANFKGRCIAFSSENKRDVEIWTEGAKATMKLLSRWSKVK